MLALLRETLVVGAVALLLLWPGCVVDHLVEAGFTRASFAGLEIDLLRQAEQTADALGTVDSVRALTDSALQVLDEVAEATDDPDVLRQVGEAREQLSMSTMTTEAAGDRLVRQLEAQPAVLASAPVPNADEAVAWIDSVVRYRPMSRVPARSPVPMDR